jgi:hypothetical protein
MIELDCPQVAKVLGLCEQTVRNHALAGRLPARRHGLRGFYRVTVPDVRRFAETYHYVLDEEQLQRYVAAAGPGSAPQPHA